jgi:hypothetical protein
MTLSAGTNDDDMNVGNIPSEISQLSSLQILNLYDNNLSGKSYMLPAGTNDV